MESLEELKSILDNAPRENIGENLFYNIGGGYMLFHEDCFYERHGCKWVRCDGFINMYGARRIDDIQRIVDLMEANLDVKENTINEVIKKRVAITETGMECWIRVADVELMRG